MTPSTMSQRLRVLAAITILVMTAAACGLKTETREAIGFAPGGNNGFQDPGGFVDDGFADDGFGDDGFDTGGEFGDEFGGDVAAGGTGGAAGGTTGSSTAGGTGGTGTVGSSGSSSSGGASGTRPAGTSGSGSGSGSGGSGGSTPPPPPPAPGAAPPPPAAAPGGGGGGGGGGAALQGSDRTGVDAAAGSINIAVHAPVTGAAPLPVTSFQEARDLYYRYRLTQVPDIGGFTSINVSFADDRYQPSTAVQACRQLAADNFFLVGAGGTDQIQACARFAEGQNIPYFSAGVTEAGLTGFRNYFAFSMSYRQQGFLLAQRIASQYSGQKVAAIITGTENFQDAVDGWEQGVAQSGINYYKTLRHPKGDTSWINTYANELKQEGVQVVYMLTAPVDYIRFAQQGGNQDFNPQYVGVGVSMGLNAVLGSGCPDVNGGEFFSPFPGLDWAQANEPEFFQAASQFGTPSDDIALSLWATAKLFEQLLVKYKETFGSNDLTREDFRNVVENAAVDTGIFPAVQFSPQNHFGANQVHVLKANCTTEVHDTIDTFKNGF